MYRGSVVRQKLHRDKDGALLIQRNVRDFLTRKKNDRSARVLQHAWKRRTQHVNPGEQLDSNGGLSPRYSESVGDVAEAIASVELHESGHSPLAESAVLATAGLELENKVLRQELMVLRAQVQAKETQVIEYESELRMARMMIEALTQGSGDTMM